MPLDLADYEVKSREAVKLFWGNRSAAVEKQELTGKKDAGERAGVTGGKNMDGFFALVVDLVQMNGLGEAEIHISKGSVTLPGFFRPTKQWDILVKHRGQLVAVLEFKSQVGPSFGNNYNNRTEEALGSATDIWTAYREGGFGKDHPRPYLGWLMLLEDCPASTKPVRDSSPHFPIFEEFRGASYSQRYNILCQKLMAERHYTAATIITSPRSAKNDGAYRELGETTGLKNFVATFAAHIAAEAARG